MFSRSIQPMCVNIFYNWYINNHITWSQTKQKFILAKILEDRMATIQTTKTSQNFGALNLVMPKNWWAYMGLKPNIPLNS